MGINKINIEDVTITWSNQSPGIPMGNDDEVIRIAMRHDHTGIGVERRCRFIDMKRVKSILFEKLNRAVISYKETINNPSLSEVEGAFFVNNPGVNSMPRSQGPVFHDIDSMLKRIESLENEVESLKTELKQIKGYA